MPKQDNLIIEREAAFALSTYSQNRIDLIAFYKALAASAGQAIPPEMKKSGESSKELVDTEKLLRKKIKEFAKSEMSGNIDTEIMRFCLALFLIDRTKKIQDAALERNNLGIYSVFATLRSQLCEFLSDKYYSETSDEIVSNYDSIEPLLVACSELCNVPVMEIETALNAYKGMLADAMETK